MSVHTSRVSAEETRRQLEFLYAVKSGWSSDFERSQGRKPLFKCITYGCQMNEHDSEKLKGMVAMAGFDIADEDAEADFVLFNTCCVRDHAEKRVYSNVGALSEKKQHNPNLIIGVCGCMMQQQEVAAKLCRRFPYVDLVFGTHALFNFPLLLYKSLSNQQRVIDVHDSNGEIAEQLPVLREKGESAYVTIMYGCDNFCTYCIVPYVRGRERSRLPGDILKEIASLSAAGVKEITLLGQNVNSYGKDLDNQINFAELLRQVDKTGLVERIRFMTSHPKDLSPQLIEVMNSCSRVCKHIHLPVQSGNDEILKQMNRHYTKDDYLCLVDSLRRRIPNIEITTDIIVGFPGETEEQFADTLALVEEANFASAFTFMYSARKGTPAAEYEGQIDNKTKKARLAALNQLQEQKCRENNQKYVGTTCEVLVEGCDAKTKPTAYGKTGNFKMIYFPGGPSLIGRTVLVRVEGCRKNSLIGRLCDRM